jgi:hypothetical protein
MSPPLYIARPNSCASLLATVVLPTAGQPEITMLKLLLFFFFLAAIIYVRLGMLVLVTLDIMPLNANEDMKNQPHR